MDEGLRPGFGTCVLLMLLERRGTGAGASDIKLRWPGGKRSHRDADAWACARREFVEETGGVVDLPAEEPPRVAWNALTKQAVYVVHTRDAGLR